MLVIKNYIVKRQIYAQIQENKTKRKRKVNSKKMREMMEQAEAQKTVQQKKK